MAENQVNPLFNIHEKYREVIIINPYRFSDPDAVAQAARIVIDGGMVVNFAYMNLVISTLKSMGIYANCKLLTDANFGVKKDPSTGAVSKLYDISGNNNDAVQAIGASQPIWSLVNGRGVITYDGNDCLVISQYTLNINHSVLFTLSYDGVTGIPSIFGMNAAYSYVRFGQTAGGELTRFFGETDTNSDNIILDHTSFTLNEKYKLCLQQNADKTWGLYSNATKISQSTARTNPLLSFVNIGGGYGSTTRWSGQLNSFSVFNTLLTTDQITQLYNLGL